MAIFDVTTAAPSGNSESRYVLYTENDLWEGCTKDHSRDQPRWAKLAMLRCYGNIAKR
jgi:hypothetical protein